MIGLIPRNKDLYTSDGEYKLMDKLMRPKQVEDLSVEVAQIVNSLGDLYANAHEALRSNALSKH
ncbi:MAG: hypothetical protein AAF739_04890 [Pseudomonadota bacterium]